MLGCLSKDIIPILEEATQLRALIAEDVTGEALPTLVVENLCDFLNVGAVKAPGFGKKRKAIMLQDIAILAEYQASDIGLLVKTKLLIKWVLPRSQLAKIQLRLLQMQPGLSSLRKKYSRRILCV